VVAVQASIRYTGTFHGRAEEARQVRREIADHLGERPVANDIVLIASWPATLPCTPSHEAAPSPSAATPA
jgi:hypothetical protein